MKREAIVHPFPAFYRPDSRILILGSFPSVKSREQMFFYGHPRNRFWKVIAALYGEEEPSSVPDKRRLLEKHRIALWDVVGLERFAKENLSKRENDKTVSRHVLLPTLSPAVVTVVSVRSTYEKCELWLETSEDFDSYFLALVRTAKENRPTEEDE